MVSTFFSAILIGLFSTLHCVGMCGGIMGALTFSLPQEVRQARPRLFGYLLLYNTGRLTSYVIAGALFGTLGHRLFRLISPEHGYFALQLIAAAVMCAMGFYLAGWFPRFAQVERIGIPIWRRLEPLGRRLLPVKTPVQALLYGLVWGWLPCGLVYSALLLSLGLGSAPAGAGFMLAFGLGTLPGVVGIGAFSHYLARVQRAPLFRQFAGILLIVLALAGLLFPHWLHMTTPFHSEQEALECTNDPL